MFLSLVRPERISSPITSSAAVTCSAAVGEFAVAIDDPTASGPTQQAIPTLPLWVMMLQVIRRGACCRPSKSPHRGGGGPHTSEGRREDARCPQRRGCARLLTRAHASSASRAATALYTAV